VYVLVVTMVTAALRRRPSPQQYRHMDYLEKEAKRTQEQDAVVRFYAMLDVLVTAKGRPAFDIDKKVMDLKIKQPLGMNDQIL